MHTTIIVKNISSMLSVLLWIDLVQYIDTVNMEHCNFENVCDDIVLQLLYYIMKFCTTAGIFNLNGIHLNNPAEVNINLPYDGRVQDLDN